MGNCRSQSLAIPFYTKKGPAWAGPFKFINKAGQTLISTSTPLGSSIFIKASTVLEELE